MKRIYLTLGCLFVFGIAAAQTDTTATKTSKKSATKTTTVTQKKKSNTDATNKAKAMERASTMDTTANKSGIRKTKNVENSTAPNLD